MFAFLYALWEAFSAEETLLYPLLVQKQVLGCSRFGHIKRLQPQPLMYSDAEGSH